MKTVLKKIRLFHLMTLHETAKRKLFLGKTMTN